MGYSTTVLQICAFHLTCLLVLTKAQVTFTVETVIVPGQSPYTPPVADNGEYDIPANATVKLRCEIPGQSATVRYQSIDIALYKRFDGSRFGKQDGLWELETVQYYDTGSLDCYDPLGDGGSKSIYLFINDPDGLYVPWNTDIVRANVREDYIPCLPTFSNVTMGVRSLFAPLSADKIKTVGIKFLSSPGRPPYICTYTVGDWYDEQSFSVQDTGNVPVYPSPSVLSINAKYHFLAGDKLVLDCSVEYLDVQSMLWEYPAQQCDLNPSDDCQVSGSRVEATDATRRSSLVISLLTVDPLAASDTGEYACSYKPLMATEYGNRRNTSVTVYPEPFVDGPSAPANINERLGEDVTISLSLEALPTPDVEWTLNSQVLQDGGKYSIVKRAPSETGILLDTWLTIHSLLPEDAGVYTVQASVPGVVYTNEYRVQVLEPPTSRLTYIYKGDKITPTEATTTVYAQPGQALDVECRAVKGVPRPGIMWYWQVCSYDRECEAQEMTHMWTPIPEENMTPEQSMIVNSPYYTLITTTNLNISLTAERSGWFRCTAVNTVDKSESRLRLAVSVLPESSKGVGFLEETLARAADLVEDDKLLLQCYVARFECADSDVQIVATVGGMSSVYMKSSPAVSWEGGDDENALGLQLNNVTTSMSGDTYACRCYNGTQGPLATLTVHAYVPATWTKSLGADTNQTMGQTASFFCEPAGKPLPVVSWYKDNKPLQTSNTVLLSKDSYNLTIVKAGVNDSGVYRCVGSSRRDTIESTFKLTITERRGGVTTGQIAMIVVLVVVVLAIAVIVTVYIVRKYCRKKYTPHTLLLPSKEMINPDIPLDEQTDALPYDIGWEFPIGNLKLGMLLGQGAFGRVLKAEAMNIEEGVASTTVAVKAVRDHTDLEQVKSLISELKILIHLGSHLNIVNLLGACTKDISKGHILVIVEYCRYGNLRSYLLKHKSNFNPSMELDDPDNNTAGVKLGHVSVDIDEDYLNEGPSELHSQEKPVSLRDIMSWCYQIARGMEYLASIDYIHRDLAARNVLLADDNIVKICDFGLAKDIYKYQEYQKQTDGPLPIKWMALESLTHKVFNVRTDVWAYGVTIWELFSLAATPYPGWEIDDTFIDKLQDGFRMEIPKHCSQQIYEEVMLSCWHPDPEKRPNFAELAEIMGESVDEVLKGRLSVLEDPYLRNRDSRTDIKIRPSSVRRRDRQDLDSAYLTTKSMQKSNGSKPSQQYSNYYNTSPSGSQPSGKKPWKKERATSDEKMPLHVQISDDDDMDMPDMPAPSPSPWERQSKLGKLAVNLQGDDSHSHHSIDSDGSAARPPSYNYVMKKSNPKASGPSVSSAVSPVARSTAHTGPSDARHCANHTKSYIETTC